MFATNRPLTLSEKLWRIRWLVPITVACLAVAGTATLYSAAGGSFQPFAERHVLRCVLGIALVIVVALVPVRIWMQLALPVYLVALTLLFLVSVTGVEALGARRWLQLGSFSFQPSELMKVGLVLILARTYQAIEPGQVSRPHWVLLPVVLIMVPVVLTLRQPDLGTAVLFAAIGFAVMFLAGVSLWYFAAAGGAAVLALPVIASHLHDYQRRRIEIFLDPDRDPLGAGYHITQSKIALGAGGFSGRGYLQGTQNQLDFVPEKLTDFIFAMIGEEWGFVGGCGLLALYALLVGLILSMAVSCRHRFGRVLIAGSALSIAIYVLINIGMVTGALPVVGVPLPFVSYGGSSLLALMFGIGLALSAHVHGQEELRPAPRSL
jgi:rod shape determining protein RodA